MRIRETMCYSSVISIQEERYFMSRIYDNYLENMEQSQFDSPIHELKEYFDLPLETVIGHDGAEYQNYIEFPEFIEYSDEDIQQVIDIFDIPLNFDFNDFDYDVTEDNNSDTHEYILTLPQGVQDLFEYSDDKKKIIFPSEDDVREAIFDLFKEYDVPSGTLYEQESNGFPESMQLYYQSEEEDLENLANEIYADIQSTLDSIRQLENQYYTVDDAIQKKAMILAAFSTVESYVIYLAENFVPSEFKTLDIKDTQLRNFLDQKIQSHFHEKHGREIIRATFAPNFPKEKNIPFRDVRNSLAHNISIGEIENEKLIFPPKTMKLNEKPVSYKISNIFKALGEYVENYSGNIDKIIEMLQS